MNTFKIAQTGEVVEVLPKQTLLEALRAHGMEVESPCAGNGKCGKCKVRLEAKNGPLPSADNQEMTGEDAAQGYRLACMTRLCADVILHLPHDSINDARILEGEALSSLPLAPAAALRELGGRYLFSYAGGEEVDIGQWQPGSTPKGLAIDLGTTTMVVTLVCLETGRELATASMLNPQITLGHDVMSRITHGSTPEGLAELAGLVRRGLNQLTAEVLEISGACKDDILDVVIGANTTMLQLAAEIDPVPLGEVPFTVGIEGARVYPAATFGLAANGAARAYVAPIAHAFIGTDISAGLLATGFFEMPGTTLFIDIGTNGELALHGNGKWLTTSAAAGPAFEGMGISAGMRAAPGAIEALHELNGELKITTIGGAEPVGICGSGLMDLVAMLLRTGVLKADGRLTVEPGPELGAGMAARLVEMDGAPAFSISDKIAFTQRDVRQLQLAKGAIRTAIDLLLETAGIAPEELDQVVLAGAFGQYLRPESVEAIGLLPRGTSKRVSFAGNASRMGSAMMLLNAVQREQLELAMERFEVLSLNEHPSFMDRFVASLFFPEAGKRDCRGV